MIPISLVRKKDSKLDGKSKVIMYAYGAYKTSIDPGFSPSRFCLIDREEASHMLLLTLEAEEI